MLIENSCTRIKIIILILSNCNIKIIAEALKLIIKKINKHIYNIRILKEGNLIPT